MVLKRSKLKLVLKGVENGPTLFRDRDGEDVRAGDTVEWLPPGDIFPTGGVTRSDMTVAVYRPVFNSWDVYKIDE